MTRLGKASQGTAQDYTGKRRTWQKTGQVRHEQGRTIKKMLLMLWINSTGIVELTCYTQVCEGCY